MTDSQTMTWWQRISKKFQESGMDRNQSEELTRLIHPVLKEIVNEQG